MSRTIGHAGGSKHFYKKGHKNASSNKMNKKISHSSRRAKFRKILSHDSLIIDFNTTILPKYGSKGNHGIYNDMIIYNDNVFSC